MIYQNSRYSKTYLYDRNSNLTFMNRERFKISLNKATIHVFKQGDTLDKLASEYLQSPHLWWVILDCNPKYRAEFEIPYGTELVIPNSMEVFECLK